MSFVIFVWEKAASCVCMSVCVCVCVFVAACDCGCDGALPRQAGLFWLVDDDNYVKLVVEVSNPPPPLITVVPHRPS